MRPRKRDENATRTDYHRAFLLYTEGLMISFTNMKLSVAKQIITIINRKVIIIDSTV